MIQTKERRKAIKLLDLDEVLSFAFLIILFLYLLCHNVSFTFITSSTNNYFQDVNNKRSL